MVRSVGDREAILKRYEASGRSLAAFCRAEGLSRSTIDLWRRKLRSKASKPSSKKTPRRTSAKTSRDFVEITPEAPAVATAAWIFEIELPDGCLARLRC
jgi:transposase-like protein